MIISRCCKRLQVDQEMEDIRNGDENVKNYLKTECDRLFANDGLSEGIECALGPGADSDRVEIIEDLISEIAALD